MTNQKHRPDPTLSLSLSLSRKHRQTLRRLRLISIISLAILLITPIGVHALIQNIFADFGQITDIQVGGDKIDLVVYQGQIIWERAPSSLQDGMNMQDATAELCADTPLGTTVNLTDTRDGKTYRVRKMADSRCWMTDNLAYDINAAGASGKPAFATTPEYDSTPSGAPNLTSVANKPQYAANTAAFNIGNNGSPTTSYLYNWCAAMGDTSANCAATAGYQAGQPATEETGICPAPFHLPIGGAAPTTLGNGTNQATAAATTANEFAKLDVWLGGTGAYQVSTSMFTSFTSDSASSPQLFFSAALSGMYLNGLTIQGTHGYYWASTAYTGAYAYALTLYSGHPSVYASSNENNKSYAFAVRCLL